MTGPLLDVSREGELFYHPAKSAAEPAHSTTLARLRIHPIKSRGAEHGIFFDALREGKLSGAAVLTLE
jgi:hypothetical protein